MPVTMKDMLAAANAVVPKITPAEAKRLVAEEGALIVDVRDGTEVAETGKAAGALHVSRGMIENRADPATAYYNPEFRFDRAIILYCASGGRAALAAKTLHDMGYSRAMNIGRFADWVESGGAVER